MPQVNYEIVKVKLLRLHIVSRHNPVVEPFRLCSEGVQRKNEGTKGVNRIQVCKMDVPLMGFKNRAIVLIDHHGLHIVGHDDGLSQLTAGCFVLHIELVVRTIFQIEIVSEFRFYLPHQLGLNETIGHS